LQKKLVGAVAEGQHREAQVLQPVGLAADRFPEQGGVVGELAVAECRGDHDEVRCRLQVGEVDLVELDRSGPDADGTAGLGE
jgi:hypothetical protein